ncbi:MAG: amidohydrolase family protein [Lachnospiraceae bacterium]|nr:amidohydrolase family protein [Lachnospiraceae bacterium]
MIIDTHVHIGSLLGFDLSEEKVLESMQKYNIDYALVSSIDSTELDFDQKEIPKELQISQEDSLKSVLAFARQYPEKIGVLVWVKPYGETISEEFVTLIEKNLDIIYGLKVHQYHSKTALDDPKMLPYLELARRFQFPVVAHTDGKNEAAVIHVWNAAKANPDIDFVMVHMGLGTDNSEAIQLLGTLPNLYGDTTWVPLESTLKAIETAGSEKMLFGSDNPIDGVDTYHHNPKGEPSVYQSYFKELEKKAGTEAYENIMYKNAIRLFGLHSI